MANNTPFILHILVADGDPDGLRIVERSNWSGKALMFPRALYPQVRKRPEFKQPGVYLLLGPRTDGEGDMLYIGEGDPVLDRFESHYAKKDFWTRAVFFVAGPGQLNKAHVQYLESQLVLRAKASKRMPLENANTPAEPTLSEADCAYMEVFLQNLLGMLPTLSIHAFEQSSIVVTQVGTPALTCKGRGATATGRDTPQGFVVESGSYAVGDEAPSLHEHFPSVSELRADLLQSGVLIPEGDKRRFTQDYTFTSPSLAAAVVLGRSANGRLDWKDAAGRTLKEIQQAQTET